jgi:hemolysin III
MAALTVLRRDHNKNIRAIASTKLTAAVPAMSPIGAARRVNRLILTVTLAFSAAAMVALVALAVAALDLSRAAAGLVYGTTLLMCSLASYLYHMLENAPRRGVLRYCDHAAIFLLIAGTYTPFAARGIDGPFGFGLLEWVWALAIVGAALKLFLDESYDRFFVGLYLAIGWLFLSALDQVISAVTPVSLAFLVVGGVAYTAGAAVYARGIGHWTDAVWHGCVLTGSLTHFIAILVLLLPVQGV